MERSPHDLARQPYRRRVPASVTDPWSGATSIAVLVTVLMAAGTVAALATEHRGLALVPAALTAFGIGLVVYTNTRRTPTRKRS